jgi:hypothetical protein
MLSFYIVCLFVKIFFIKFVYKINHNYLFVYSV